MDADTDVITCTAGHFEVQRAHIMRLSGLVRRKPTEDNQRALADARARYAADMLERSIRQHLADWPELGPRDRQRLAHVLVGDEP